MKVKVSPKKTHQKAERASQKAARKIMKANFDRHPMIVGSRMPASKVLGEVRNTELVSLNKRGFLITKGPRGLYTSEVLHNGKGVYARADVSGSPIFESEQATKDSKFRFGSIEALNGTGREDFSAEIVSKAELIARAQKVKKVITVEYAAKEETLTVALLNTFGDRFVGGVTLYDGRLWAITMEHPSGRNSKGVQYANPKDVNGRKFLASLAG